MTKNKVSYTIHYLENAAVDLSEKDRVAIYDYQIGGHGISISKERFFKLAEAVKKQENLK